MAAPAVLRAALPLSAHLLFELDDDVAGDVAVPGGGGEGEARGGLLAQDVREARRALSEMQEAGRGADACSHDKDKDAAHAHKEVVACCKDDSGAAKEHCHL